MQQAQQATALSGLRRRLGWAQCSWGAPDLRAAAIEEFLELAAAHPQDAEQLEEHELRQLAGHVHEGGHTLPAGLVERLIDFLQRSKGTRTRLMSGLDT